MSLSRESVTTRLTEIITRVEGIQDIPIDYFVLRKLEVVSTLLHGLLIDVYNELPLADRLLYSETMGKVVSGDE